MLKILDLSPMKYESVYFYRGPWFARDLDGVSIAHIDVNQIEEQDLFWLIGQYHMVYICRPYGEKVFNACRVAKSINRSLWIDFDDNIWDLSDPRYTEEEKFFFAQIGKLPGIADIVTCTNQWIADKITSATGRKEVYVVDNAFNDHVFHISDLLSTEWNEKSDTAFVRANGHASLDLIRMEDTLLKVVSENRDISFVFIGRFDNYIRHHLMADFGNVVFLDHMDIYQYYMTIRSLKPKYYLRPMPSSEFNYGKSGCSVIESVWAGAIPFVPAMPEFTKYGAPLLSDFSGNVGSKEMYSTVKSRVTTMRHDTDNKRISILKKEGMI